MGTTTIDGSTVADPGGGAEGAMASPSPVQTSHKKDGRQRRPHRFHVSCPPHPTAGSDADPGIFSIGLLSPYYKKLYTLKTKEVGIAT